MDSNDDRATWRDTAAGLLACAFVVLAVFA